VPKLVLAIQEDPSFPVPYRYLAACYGHMGRLAEAREILGRLRAVSSVFIPDAGHLRNTEHRELLLSGLRLATGADSVITTAPPRVELPRDLVPSHPREAERRQITVLSCELVGAVPGGDGVALEDLREAVGDFQRCVSEAADRHQGLVCRELGNSALVLFGYPEALEHDAEQAIRAGLELCAAVRTLRPDADAPVQCRVGIATGAVIVGEPVGAEGIVGDAPNLAARLAVSTQPGTVTIDPATRRLIGGLFDCRELDAIQAAGGSGPIRSWQVVRDSIVESRFEALRGPALTSLGRPRRGDRPAIAPLGTRQGGRRPDRAGFRANRALASRASLRRWKSGSAASRISCCVISVLHTTRTARYSRLSTSSLTRRVSAVTIYPRSSGRSSRPCSHSPGCLTRMWLCLLISRRCRLRNGILCRASVRSGRKSGHWRR
jgi:class 3 adenylate cyclase